MNYSLYFISFHHIHKQHWSTSSTQLYIKRNIIISSLNVALVLQTLLLQLCLTVVTFSKNWKPIRTTTTTSKYYHLNYPLFPLYSIILLISLDLCKNTLNSQLRIMHARACEENIQHKWHTNDHYITDTDKLLHLPVFVPERASEREVRYITA